MSGGSDNGGGAAPLPKNRVVGKVVLAAPPAADTGITNADAIKGNIALIDRGGTAPGNTFDWKIKEAIKAGAVAVILASNRDPGAADYYPLAAGGIAVTGDNIPFVMVTKEDGTTIKSKLAEGVTASIGDDPSLILGTYDGGRGVADTIFGFKVPQAGVYPMRSLWYEGDGDASVEWFTLQPDGTRILVNDSNNAASLKAYKTRAYTPPPDVTISIARAGETAKITFTGVLQAADKVDGTYAPVTGATSPYTVPAGTTTKYYRAASN